MKINFKIPEDKFFDYQKSFLYSKERFAYLEACPQSGKTDTLLCLIIKWAIEGGPNKNYWWTAPSNRAAGDAFQRLQRRIRASNIPNEAIKIKIQEQSIEFVNAGKIYFLSNDSVHTLVGITVHGVVVDEAAFVREDAWYLILTRLAQTAGPVRCASNVQGAKNWYYKLCQKAERGELTDTYYQKITVEDAIRVGLQTRENIEQLKQNYTKARFEELYYCIAREGTTNVFNYDKIYKSIIQQPTDRTVVIYGIDLAKSYDYTVITGLNINKEVVYIDRFQHSWEQTKQIILDTIADVPTFIDSTGVGDPIVEALSIYKDNIYGFTFTNKSKGNIVDKLVIGFEEEQIKIVEDISSDLVKELENFEYEFTTSQKVRYNGATGTHDDCVCSLALAFYHFDNYVQTSSLLAQEVDIFG